MKWHNQRLQKLYERQKYDMIRRGFSDSQLSEHLQYLNNPDLKTKSVRISQMNELAYYLGMLRGLRMVDEMLFTPVVLDDVLCNMGDKGGL